MMFVAGVLIWANIPGPETIVQADRMGRPVDVFYHLRTCGWPLRMTYISRYTSGPNSDIFSGGRYEDSVHVGKLLVNFAVGVAIFAIVWFSSEWLIRRRAMRKGA